MKSIIMRALLILYSVGACFVFIHLGDTGWPGLHWDSTLFGTPVINVALSNRWQFGGWTQQIIARPDLEYNFHGLLHVIFYGEIVRANTWEKYLRAQGVINAITYLAYCYIYVRILANRFGYRVLTSCFALILASVAGLLCIGLQGRPEQLAPLVLCMPLISYCLGFDKKISYLFTIACNGFLIVLSPLLSLVFTSALSLEIIGNHNVTKKHIIKYLLSLVICSLLFSSALIVLFTPFNIFTWVKEVVKAGSQSISFEGIVLMFSKYKWGFTLLAPFWNILSGIIISASILWLSRKKSAGTICLATIAFLLFLNQKMCDYSYVAFIPYSLGLILIGDLNIVQLSPAAKTLKLSAYALTGAISSFYLLFIILYFFCSFQLPASEVSLSSARKFFRDSSAGISLYNQQSAVGFNIISNPSLVVLGSGGPDFVGFFISEEPRRTEELSQYESSTNRFVDYVVYDQGPPLLRTSPPVTVYIDSTEFNLVDSTWAEPTNLDSLIRPKKILSRYTYGVYKRSDRKITQHTLNSTENSGSS